ncbi:MAG: OmpA family protein [bacterium]
MIKLKKLLFVVFFLCLANIGYGEDVISVVSIDNTLDPPGVMIGGITSEWKGLLEVPVWTLTKVSLAKESYFMMPEKQNQFRFGVVCQAKNSCGFDESYIVSLMIEKETFPHSDKWCFVGADRDTISCRAKSVDIRNFLTAPVFQKEPEARYRLTVCSRLTVGQKTTKEITYLTMKCSSEYQWFYTTIPFLPLSILHDPNGDTSFTELTSKAQISHLMRFAVSSIPVRIEEALQEELSFSSIKGNLLVKRHGTDTLELVFTPSQAISSEKSSESPNLIGPGYGDTYILAKNIPIKVVFSQAEGKKSCFFQVVSAKEAGIQDSFEIITLSAGSIREGSMLSDELKKQLASLNIGWDNQCSGQEKTVVTAMGNVYLNDKELKASAWTQQTLVPTLFRIGLPIDSKQLEVTLNPGDASNRLGIDPREIKIYLADKNCKQEPCDFFSYQMYIDRCFGTPLFLTLDDKAKPANRTALHGRSISSMPTEYWTSGWQGTIVAEAHIGHPIDGRIEDTGIPVKGVIFEEHGTTIAAQEEGEQYIFRELSTGEHLITAKAHEFKPSSQKIDVSSVKSSYLKMLLIPEEPFVYGLVKDSGTGVGLSGTTLDVLKGQSSLRQTKAGLTGNYSIDNLNKGIEYTIISSSEGYEKRRQPVFFGPEQTVARVDFLLTKALPPAIVEKTAKDLSPPIIAAKPALAPEAPIEIIAPPMQEKPAPLKALAEIKGEKGLTVKEDKGTIKIEMTQAAVNFVTGSHVVQATAHPVLTKVANILKAYPDYKVMIGGHTDNVPLGQVTQKKYKDNKGLSQARAEGVMAFLTEREGVPSANLTAVGYGEAKPVASNKTLEGKAQNRRVEITIKKPEVPVPFPGGLPPVATEAAQIKAIPAPELPKPVVVEAKPKPAAPPVPVIAAPIIPTPAPELPKPVVVEAKPKPVVPPVPVVTAPAIPTPAPELPKPVVVETKLKPAAPPVPVVAAPAIPTPAPELPKPVVVEAKPKPVVPPVSVVAAPTIPTTPAPELPKPAAPPVPAIAPAIATLLPTVYPMLTNGGFDDGMNAWTSRKEGDGNIYVGLTNDSQSHSSTIEMKRQKSQSGMGEAGISQLLNIDVYRYTQINLKAAIKIDGASMSGDGKAGGEYPVCLELRYTGTDGKPYIFKHGFLAVGKLNYPDIGEQIKKGQWVTYVSPNLTQLSPRPVKITEARVIAKGWDFVSRVDGIELQLGMLPAEVAEVHKPTGVVISEKKPQVPAVSQITTYAKLMNGGFEQGMECWQSVAKGSGKIKAEIVKDDDQHPHSLEISRQDSNSTTGGASVFQMLDSSVIRYNLCVLRGEIKVLSSSLSGDNQQNGYPVCLEIEYMDITGKPHLFRHGFLTKGKLQYPESGEMIKKNTWIGYSTPNLMELSPKPAKITCIRIKGDGWDMVSRVDNLIMELSSKPMEKPIVIVPKPKIEMPVMPKPEIKEEVKPVVKKESGSWIMDEGEALGRFGEMESAGMERLAESLVVDPKGMEELSILLVSPSINPKQAARILYKLYQIQGDKAVNKVLKIVGDINQDKAEKIKKLLTK